MGRHTDSSVCPGDTVWDCSGGCRYANEGENEGPARYSTDQSWRGLSGVKDTAFTALCSQQGLPDSVEGFVRGRKEKRERHLLYRLLWEGKGLDVEESDLWVIRNMDSSHLLCPRTFSSCYCFPPQMLSFMHAQYTFFQQGYSLLHELDPYMKKLATEVRGQGMWLTQSACSHPFTLKEHPLSYSATVLGNQGVVRASCLLDAGLVMPHCGMTAKSYGHFQCTPKYSPFPPLWGCRMLSRAGVIPEQ